jgi:2-polyprenyl-6-methoxyphenol hydroxylase-like FAD-dependent oxidoreductase
LLLRGAPANVVKTTFDVAIVGAGPAGASAAILLARAGWSVVLVERQTFPRRKVCGECIAASNLDLLEALGIGAQFDRLAGAELRRVALMRGDETVTASLPPGEGAHRWGRALGREHLDTLLADAAEAAGATRLQPASLQSIAGRAGSFVLRVRELATDGAEIELHAGLVVAAHGSWEPLPSERARRRESRSPGDLFAFKANFRAAAIDLDLLPVLSFAGGYGGMVVADGGLATLACCVRDDRLQALRTAVPGARAGEVVEQMLRRECAGVGAALATATRDGAWLASGPLRPGVRLASGDGVFRVGNAAGEAHPIVGEGISMALQSAFVLVALLAPEKKRLVDPASAVAAQGRAIAAYEALWRRRFARRLRIAAAFAQLAMRPALAGAAWPLVRRWPGVLSAGARLSGKTRCAPEAASLIGGAA